MAPVWLVAVVAASAPGAEAPAELLRKLAEHEARMMTVYREAAVTMSSKVEELNGDGKVEHSQEVVVRLELKDGKQESELVRATRDGQDITADERREQEARKAKAESEPKETGKKEVKVALSTPFGADVQEKYRFTVLGPDQHDPKKLRVGFAPKGKKSKELWIGEAVVDPEIGSLHWMKQRPSEFPTFVDQMEMVLEFHTSTPAGPAISAVRIDGKGGLPFFKKTFRALTSFSDWAMAPAAAP
jgi:hypothetical protein